MEEAHKRHKRQHALCSESYWFNVGAKKKHALPAGRYTHNRFFLRPAYCPAPLYSKFPSVGGMWGLNEEGVFVVGIFSPNAAEQRTDSKRIDEVIIQRAGSATPGYRGVRTGQPVRRPLFYNFTMRFGIYIRVARKEDLPIVRGSAKLTSVQLKGDICNSGPVNRLLEL